jgi:putative membrane protein
MNRPRHAMVTLAAATLLSGGIFAMAADPVAQGVQPAAANNNNAMAPANDQAGRQATDELRQFAQDPQTAPDKMFLLNAATDNMCEIQLSQQAVQHAQSQQVKNLAQRMIQDHTALGQKAQPVAQALGIQLPTGISEMQQAEIDVYAALPGKTFDEQFLAHMNAAHDKAIACFEAAASLSNNAQVKQFASDALPTLRMHRDMVRQTAAALGVNLGGAEATPAAAHLPGANGSQMDTGGGSGTGTNASGTGTPGTGGSQNPTK